MNRHENINGEVYYTKKEESYKIILDGKEVTESDVLEWYNTVGYRLIDTFQDGNNALEEIDGELYEVLDRANCRIMRRAYR